MKKLWNTQLEINVDNFKSNLNEIQNFIGPNVGIMAIIKDNAYGSYLNNFPELFNNCEMLGVAIADEGIALREKGHVKDILILNQPFPSEIDAIEKYNLTVAVASISFLKELAASKKLIKIHIEIETGMERTGIAPKDADIFLKELKKYPNLIAEGIFTHFSSSDSDEEYTKKQLEIFKSVLPKFKMQLPALKYIHTASSSAMIKYPETHFNLVRPGMCLYGYHHNKEIQSILPLKPVMRLKSKISFIKDVSAGTSIGYGRSFITTRPSKIATIHLGYADGVRRELSNKGSVVINNQVAPIVGKTCMDCFMVDITDIVADLYDDVYIWDNELIKTNDIANICNTVVCDITSTISPRVPRYYI